MEFNDEELKKLQKQSEEAQKQKSLINLAGTIGDAMASAPSFGEVYLGRNVAKPNISGITNALAGTIEDPIERRQKVYQQYQAMKQAKMAAEDDDPTSQKSTATREAFKAALGPKLSSFVNDNMSASTLDKHFSQISPLLKERMQQQTEMAKLNAKVPKGFMKQIDPATGQEQLVPENPNKLAFEHLPKESQIQIEELGKKNGNKESIRNQLDANLTTLQDPKLPEDQKLIAARSIIKVLNSSEGSDAVGVEEAKRLSGLLEFRTLNLTEPGPMFGRAPISDFANQIALKSQELKDAVGKNRQTIASIYGNSGSSSQPSNQDRILINTNHNKDNSNAYAGDVPQVRVYQGELYTKTQGGWKKMKSE